MTIKIHTRPYDERHVVIATDDLQRLIETASKVAPIEVEDETAFGDDDLMRLAETGGAFDSLHDEREDIYSIEDLRMHYR
ncbi:MAG: hypothetical protein MSG64_04180 [Pyrinomonadaceae bacterium MAG19_C2-C3]|nr:hypothetical protein [Pyrinomonadaceae bacterium MAG19_C2-C3]